eukprot:NODE_6891_length_810_cov_91.574964_g6655_i0.p1 GENE.NODE_6891_length_810_cov_91.574964_g6655_i0~~NODE_6891_length_810_cov_91.574964_g6655_i0.p1  ORF type:complete len:184 (+),score=26.22 NODE_6891_length_810_cov_91.574964_g6655_i0:71-622(+)
MAGPGGEPDWGAFMQAMHDPRTFQAPPPQDHYGGHGGYRGKGKGKGLPDIDTGGAIWLDTIGGRVRDPITGDYVRDLHGDRRGPGAFWYGARRGRSPTPPLVSRPPVLGSFDEPPKTGPQAGFWGKGKGAAGSNTGGVVGAPGSALNPSTSEPAKKRARKEAPAPVQGPGKSKDDALEIEDSD